MFRLPLASINTAETLSIDPTDTAAPVTFIELTLINVLNPISPKVISPAASIFRVVRLSIMPAVTLPVLLVISRDPLPLEVEPMLPIKMSFAAMIVTA